VRHSTGHRDAPTPYPPHDRQSDRDPSRAPSSSQPNPSDSTRATSSRAQIHGCSTFALTSSSPTKPPPPAHNASAGKSRVRAAPQFACKPSTWSGARLGLLVFGPDGRLRDVNPGESVEAYANDDLLDKRGDYATSTLQASGSALVAAKQNTKRRGGRCDQCSDRNKPSGCNQQRPVCDTCQWLKRTCSWGQAKEYFRRYDPSPTPRPDDQGDGAAPASGAEPREWRYSTWGGIP